VDIDLRDRTEVSIRQRVTACDGRRAPTGKLAGSEMLRAWAEHRAFLSQFKSPPRDAGCRMLQTSGCTTPARANQELLVEYQDPAGNPVYHLVPTDANGCFEDAYIAVSGGDWTATVDYPGGRCAGPTRGTVTIPVDLPRGGDQDLDGLPDGNEIDGDADGDGIPNFLDPDGDDDGVRDGKEPRGDVDRDGVDDVVDADSDGDGIIDGRDPNPYRLCHHGRGVARMIRWLVAALWLLALVLLFFARLRRASWPLLLAGLVLALALLLTWLYCLDLWLWPAAAALPVGCLIAYILWRPMRFHSDTK